MKDITILIPTYSRITPLAALLTSLCSQTYSNFDLVISDQNEDNRLFENRTLNTIIRILQDHGHHISIKKHLPRRGIAEQRQFLLDQVTTPFCLFLDDDLLLEPFVIEQTRKAILEENCGFVGRAAIGLSYKHDFRPDEQTIETWKGNVLPEKIKPGTKKWLRHKLHNAANMYHVANQLNLQPEHQLKYKIAWIGACVLYDTAKLRDVGGFMFWKHLPTEHCGEDVLAQLRLMAKYGGCGLLPSGVYHQEVPTTIQNREFNAPDVLSTEL